MVYIIWSKFITLICYMKLKSNTINTHFLFCYYFQSNRKGLQKKQRAKNVLNLGITNRKIDQQYRVSISGRVGLNLIQSCTKDRCLSNDTLKNIGNLLMYIIDECLPRTPFEKEFKKVTQFEKEYLDLFADQLLIHNKAQKERFCIPAISFLINGELNPHCDVMNPTTSQDDYTICLYVQIPKDKLPSSVLHQVDDRMYPFSIPFCLVVYKRKALCYYRDRMKRMHEYINTNVASCKGRRLLVKQIMCANTSLDYVGTFFDQNTRITLKEHFVTFGDRDVNIFPYKTAVFTEAIDKLGYYSGLLHVIFLYIYKFGVDVDECLSIILFYGLHGASNTLSIVTILLQMVIETNKPHVSSTTFYNVLFQKYIALTTNSNTNQKELMNSIPIDTYNSELDQTEVLVHLVSINSLLAKARNRMGLLKPTDMKKNLSFTYGYKSCS